MGHKTVMRSPVTVAILLGLVVNGVISGFKQESVRTVVFGYKAERQKTGIWDFLVKTAANASWEERPKMEIGIQITETEHPQDVGRGSWVEIAADAHVSNNAAMLATTLPQAPSTSAPKEEKWSIPADYIQIAGLGYYKVHRESVRWETARRVCAREGGHLLILNSAVEAAAVVVPAQLPGWSWLGFDDFSFQGEYVTLHGTTLEEAGYTQWAANEPEKDLRCGVVDSNGRLGSGNCDLERSFICEFHSPDEHVREVRDPSLRMGYRAVGSLGFYRAHRDRAQWETARRRCRAEGARLAVPNTQLEASAVFAASGLRGWFWVGFDDFDSPGSYVNFDGQRLGNAGVYSTFAPDEPDTKIHCGIARDDAKLGTGTCKLKREYICERYKTDVQPPMKAPSSTPPQGYVSLGGYTGSLYKVHRDVASWEAARRRCEAEGAHLIFVNSQDEAESVLTATGLPGWFWLGFDDFTHEGEYVYLDGTRLVDSGYVKWASEEPVEDLHCGVARQDALLGTGTCKMEREYVCEWDKPRPPAPPPKYPNGYKKVGALGVYKVHRDRAAWETARRRCEAEGARLLVVNSQEEADAVLQGSGLPGWFWLGFDDFDAHGQYLTLDGTTLRDAGFEEWASEEPESKLHCGVATAKGFLGTGNCKIFREYICELI